VLRITWVGHSTVLVELDGVSLLTDPVLRARLVHLRRVAEHAAAPPGQPDAALVSHLHHDHLDLRSLRRLGPACRIVVPRGGGALLRRHRLRNVEEVSAGDELHVGPLLVRATPAAHDGKRGVLGPVAPALGYLLEGSARVYFAGDTDLFDGMRQLAPDLDVALLPVGGWGPRLPEGHLDPDGAARALQLLRPRLAIPIHYGTYRRIGLPEPAESPGEAFARAAGQLAPEVDVRVLPVGGTLAVQPTETAS
jgi:L-ascorbate metabolism protein UlaG (beta-lactamase superfamily)